MSIIMFDTNAYRGLAYSLKGKSEADIDAWIATLNNVELAAGHKKELNFWVVCELLKHMKDPDYKGYDDCFLGLQIALHHCTHMNMLHLSKPIEAEIADYYNLQEKQIYYHTLYKNVIALCTELITNGRTETFSKYIPAIDQYILDFQDMLIPGFVDGKAELYKAKEFDLLKAKGFMDESAFKMIIRSIVHGISKIEEPLTDEDVEYFLEMFYYGSARICRIIDKTPTTEGFRNHIIDAEICLRIGKNDDRIIVSNDGSGDQEGLLHTFKSLGAYPDKAMTTADYYKSIDFEIDGPEKAVAV